MSFFGSPQEQRYLSGCRLKNIHCTAQAAMALPGLGHILVMVERAPVAVGEPSGKMLYCW